MSNLRYLLSHLRLSNLRYVYRRLRGEGMTKERALYSYFRSRGLSRIEAVFSIAGNRLLDTPMFDEPRSKRTK